MPKRLNLRFDPIERAAQHWTERWGGSSAMPAITSVMRAQQILLAEVDAILKEYGLTFARYEALVLLVFSRRGALPLSKMGERLMVHPTSVTNIIDRLERSGLVRREPNPRDGRGTLAAITDEGRAVVERATEDLMAADFGMRALTDEERRSLFEVLRTLRLAAGDFVEDDDADAAEQTETGEATVGEATVRQVAVGEAVAEAEPLAESLPGR